MCGICGKLEFDPGAKIAPNLLERMADAILHRGPDDEGFYVNGQIGLGFRRLSIIDLSGGHQPLSNENDSIWIIFNGEIYNYQELRAELVSKGHIFRTKSDTEVIVHLYEEYGRDCVQKLRSCRQAASRISDNAVSESLSWPDLICTAGYRAFGRSTVLFSDWPLRG